MSEEQTGTMEATTGPPETETPSTTPEEPNASPEDPATTTEAPSETPEVAEESSEDEEQPPPPPEKTDLTPQQKLLKTKAKVKTGAKRAQTKAIAAVGQFGKGWQHSSAAVRVDLNVLQGRNLVAKDRDAMGFGEPTSSDPYIKLIVGGVCVGKTETVYETLNPKFKCGKFHFFFEPDVSNAMLAGRNPGGGLVRLRIYDHDRFSSDDNMGTVLIPLNLRNPPSTKWYPATPGSGKRYCKNSSGEVQVYIEVTLPEDLRETDHAEDSDDDDDEEGVEVELNAKDDSEML